MQLAKFEKLSYYADMILRQLHLVNFRRFDNLALQFDDGITGIVGKNGTGKSSILEAILWCLYGNRAARTGKDGIKRQAASPADTCSVTLEFELNGTVYRLTRSLIGKGNRTETKLTQQGKLDAITTREVDQYIVKLIGLNLKGFLSSFFARQKELNVLSDARPAERRNHLAKMLGVGTLDNAIEVLKRETKEIRQKIDLFTSLQIDPEAVRQTLDGKKEQIEPLKRQAEEETKSQKRLDEDISLLDKKLNALRQSQTQFIQLDKQKTETSSRRDALNKDKKRLSNELEEIKRLLSLLPNLEKKAKGVQELEKKEQELISARAQQEEKQRLEEERKRFKNKYNNILKDKERLDALQKQLTDGLKEKEVIQTDLTKREEKRDMLRKEYTQVKSELATVQDNIRKLKEQKEQIDSLGPEAVCEFCLRPFGEDFSNIEAHFNQELLSLEQRANPLSKRLVQIEQEGEHISKHIQELQIKNKHIIELENKLTRYTAELNGCNQSIGDLNKQIESISARLKELKPIEFSSAILADLQADLAKKRQAREEFVRLKERVSRQDSIIKELELIAEEEKRHTERFESIQAEIQSLEYSPDEHNKAQEKAEALRKELSESKIAIERITGEINVILKEQEQLQQQLREYERSKKEISALREQLRYREKLSLLFADFRVFLIGRIRPALSRQTSQLFHEMTGGRYQEVELDEDYNLRLYDNGEHFPIDRFSGGEIDLANLCFRLAISLEMAASAGIQNSFVILDEIFGSQDEERQCLIVEGLTRLRNRFRQIIIVSHIDNVKELSEHIISVELENTGISRAVAEERS